MQYNNIQDVREGGEEESGFKYRRFRHPVIEKEGKRLPKRAGDGCVCTARIWDVMQESGGNSGK